MESEEQTGNNLSALVRNAPAVRQVLLLIGLAVSIGLGLAAALWLSESGYSTLYASVTDAEAAEIVASLQASGIEYQLDPRTGAIMVPPDALYEARMALASDGLPHGGGYGMEIIQSETGITSSQVMENARLHHALETELARTIQNMRSVQSARVHLGLPQSSVFVRDRNERSASVQLTILPGRSLDSAQVQAIAGMVAGSIPELEAGNVFVTDQNGRMLNGAGENDDLAQSARQFDHVRRIETNMEDRIIAMLAPLVGPENVRASVSAEVDFTVQEESREAYDPANTVVRSEQIEEDRSSSGSTVAAGVPGALSNTPPQVGAAANAVDPAAQAQANTPGSESVRQTRNFEVDRTMSVTRRQSGTISRLSVAVVLNETMPATAEGAAEGEDAGDDAAADAAATPAMSVEDLVLKADEIVRQAVGLDEVRGDTLTVSTAPYYQAPPMPAMEEPSFFTSPEFFGMLRQGLSVVAILLVGFGMVRPIIRMITAPAPEVSAGVAALPGGATVAAVPPAQLSYDEKVGAVRQLVDRDSERVARIVKEWVGADG